jgi:hypothetical protein
MEIICRQKIGQAEQHRLLTLRSTCRNPVPDPPFIRFSFADYEILREFHNLVFIQSTFLQLNTQDKILISELNKTCRPLVLNTLLYRILIYTTDILTIFVKKVTFEFSLVQAEVV